MCLLYHHILSTYYITLCGYTSPSWGGTHCHTGGVTYITTARDEISSMHSVSPAPTCYIYR
uniref:Uncharacterized protein n=1 Tax=Octopus bimaculoides TaxID=37653 RepID=A0A0L8HTT7_OCTBM